MLMDAETQNTVSFINLAAVFFFALVLAMVMVRTYMKIINVMTNLLDRVVDVIIERKRNEPYAEPELDPLDTSAREDGRPGLHDPPEAGGREDG